MGDGERSLRLISPPWRERVCRCLDRAEASVAAYYAVQPREWATRFRYDLGSSHDHPEISFPPGALAQILRVDPPPRGKKRFRIVLRDPEILRLGEQFGLDPVLTFTLAHELVHLVRFAHSLAPFELTGRAHAEEEERVSRIAVEALRADATDTERAGLEALLDHLLPAA